MEGFVHNGHQPKRDIVDRQFLVACAQGAILLVPTHYLLHDMPLPIGCLVELLVPWLVASCRDHGLDSPLATPKSDAWVAIIPSPENSRAPVPRIVSIGQDRLGVEITPGA